MAAVKQATGGAIYIPQIERATFELRLVGDTPLVVHNFSEKARLQISHTEEKSAKGPKETRKPQEEAAACLYLASNGKPGFPVRGFKASIADATLMHDGVSKMDVRRLVWIDGEIVPIESDGWEMREDMVRLAGPSRTPEVRWRPQFWPWAVELTITTQPTLMPPEAIVNLFNWAGAFIGVGEDRPGKSGGDWGRFHVATTEESDDTLGQ